MKADKSNTKKNCNDKKFCARVSFGIKPAIGTNYLTLLKSSGSGQWGMRIPHLQKALPVSRNPIERSCSIGNKK